VRRLDLLVPDPANSAYGRRWPPVFEGYAALFARHGVQLAPHPWTELRDGSTGGEPATLAVLAWGYHFAPDLWLKRLADWPSGVPLLNPPAVLRWNTRKTYLAELAAAGAPVVPTLTVAQVDAATLAEGFARFGTDEIVVKPQVSGAAHRTARLRVGEPAPDGLTDALIQPFLPAVESEGELSLFYFGGRFSHAVRKVAAPGDFRVQPQFGGLLTAINPGLEAHEAADCVLGAAACGAEPLTYARVDLIRGRDGRLALMELEAIEPDLYLDLAPDRGDAFAQAVLSRLER